MITLREVAKAFVPTPARTFARSVQRDMILSRAIRDVRASLERSREAVLPRELFDRMGRGWENSGFAAGREFLEAALRLAQTSRGPILECGSGLSTLLLGLVAERRELEVWTLEHHAVWARRVQRVLDRFGIRSVKLCLAPLKRYGSFDWYDAPTSSMPDKFCLLICDGPPGETFGGRYGVIPVLGSRLAPGSDILLDDVVRDAERETAMRWRDELGATLGTEGVNRQFAHLVLPA